MVAAPVMSSARPGLAGALTARAAAAGGKANTSRLPHQGWAARERARAGAPRDLPGPATGGTGRAVTARPGLSAPRGSPWRSPCPQPSQSPGPQRPARSNSSPRHTRAAATSHGHPQPARATGCAQHPTGHSPAETRGSHGTEPRRGHGWSPRWRCWGADGGTHSPRAALPGQEEQPEPPRPCRVFPTASGKRYPGTPFQPHAAWDCSAPLLGINPPTHPLHARAPQGAAGDLHPHTSLCHAHPGGTAEGTNHHPRGTKPGRAPSSRHPQHPGTLGTVPVWG